MSKLYKTADGRYGTLLTQDSKGNYILEMSGNGGVLPFDPKELEVVRPYTVRCVTLTPVAGKNNCVSHYRAKQGSVKVGDVVVTSSNVLVRVTSVDTKTDTEAVLDGVVLDSRPLEALFDIDEE